MKRYIFSLILLGAVFLFAQSSWGDDTELFSTQAKPNILIIFDNSNSMDEDFIGNAAGSFRTASKAVHGKKALQNIIEQNKNKLRFGLLTYKLPGGVVSRELHNSPYFVSYDPRSYCPNPPPECVEYARTGNAGAKTTCETECGKDNPLFEAGYLDEIINNYPIGSEQRNRYSSLIFPKRQRAINPADPTRYIYFKNAYPFYSGSNEGTRYCYSGGYNLNEGAPWDTYSCYTSKTQTNDDFINYSGIAFTGALSPTDSDYALGYLDFGRRLQWYYVSKTWFSNSSPGDGYLHVGVDYLTNKFGVNTATYTNIMNKLDPKENDEAQYMSCGNADKNTCPYVVNAGLTPTPGTLETAANYFKGIGYTSPIEDWCQKNFIIYVTDGLPSVNESGTPQNADMLMPTVLTKIENLRNITRKIKGIDYNFDIKTYVLGVGLSDEAKPKLDAMAQKGGTDVYGKAYYADNPEQLNQGLADILQSIIGNSYSFASPSIPSVRMVDGAMLYISSFTPQDIGKSPFWPGNLEAYKLESDGTLKVKSDGKPFNAPIWNAGEKLRDMSHASRKIYTYVSGAKREFTSANIMKEDLGVETDADRDNVVNYIRGNTLDTWDIDMDGNKTEQRPWKLGDIFHSNSAIVGSPSPFFADSGYSGVGGFYENNKSRKRLVIVGANDGMLHAFHAGDWNDAQNRYDDGTGEEEWAFIPNSLLKNLKSALTTYTYYVDSSPKAADVWFGDLNSNGKKDPNEWKTVLVSGLRKGGKHYFALDITDNLNPTYLWEFPKAGDTTTLNKVGQSWSEPAIGRVKIKESGKLIEKWVAFIGGGFDPSEKNNPKADIGMSFFVIDITNGNIIWEFSYNQDDDKKKFMKYSIPAPPAAVDTNSDGYIDKVYIGDLGGQMWVFDVSSDEVTQWYDNTKRLFEAPAAGGEKHKIYYQPTVAFDKNRKPWVFFGTGDREDPKDWGNPKERLYAVQDDGLPNYPRKEGTDLKDVTGSDTFIPDPTKKGWFLKLDRDDGKSLEKVIAKASVFNQLVYFSTYTNIETSDLCAVGGISKEYILYYLSAGGAIDVDDMSDLLGAPTPSSRSRQIGEGAPSPPVISVNLKGKASVIIGTTSGQIYSEQAFSPSTNKPLLYWREVVR